MPNYEPSDRPAEYGNRALVQPLGHTPHQGEIHPCHKWS